LARRARGPIQLLATEWAAKKPAEKSSIPAKITQIFASSVISTPASIMPVEASITGPRPYRVVIAPAFGELQVPVR